jgi:hypothetical protein
MMAGKERRWGGGGNVRSSSHSTGRMASAASSQEAGRSWALSPPGQGGVQGQEGLFGPVVGGMADQEMTVDAAEFCQVGLMAGIGLAIAPRICSDAGERQRFLAFQARKTDMSRVGSSASAGSLTRRSMAWAGRAVRPRSNVAMAATRTARR